MIGDLCAAVITEVGRVVWAREDDHTDRRTCLFVEEFTRCGFTPAVGDRVILRFRLNDYAHDLVGLELPSE